MRVPFVVYADFEALVKPIVGNEPDSGTSFTNPYQKHKPCGFCYHIECFDDESYSQKPVIYTAKRDEEDVSQIFVEIFGENIKKNHRKFAFPKKMIFTNKNRLDFNEATVCWICGDLLDDD